MQAEFVRANWRLIVDALHLSAREAQIALGILYDETEQAIAERLGISRHTVHTHLGRLYRKLRVRNRSQLVALIFTTYIGLREDR